MLMHKMSMWFSPGYDEELARAEALEEWFQQIHKRGYRMAKNPRVHLIHDTSNPVRGASSRVGKKVPGFRVSVQGAIEPREDVNAETQNLGVVSGTA